mgnify:CR=1 FL=1
MKIIAVIPARLASTRFPNKVLFNFFGLPMVEHVRRRALLSGYLSEVYVATCDNEIADTINSYGGKVILTSNKHPNGTSRVAEAVSTYDCSHVLLLQGDEPLLLPRHIDTVITSIKENQNKDAWNATGKINSEDELNSNSFVKCAVMNSDNILHCFRRTPYFSNLDIQQKFVRKLLGVIAYRKDFLLHLATLKETIIESTESIEQMRIIENGYELQSVPVEPSLPSVNEPHETDLIFEFIKNNVEQKIILEKTLSFLLPS